MLVEGILHRFAFVYFHDRLDRVHPFALLELVSVFAGGAGDVEKQIAAQGNSIGGKERAVRGKGEADRDVAFHRIGGDNSGGGIDAIIAELFIRRQGGGPVFALVLKGAKDKGVGARKDEQEEDADDQGFFRFLGFFVHGIKTSGLISGSWRMVANRIRADKVSLAPSCSCSLVLMVLDPELGADQGDGIKIKIRSRSFQPGNFSLTVASAP